MTNWTYISGIDPHWKNKINGRIIRRHLKGFVAWEKDGTKIPGLWKSVEQAMTNND